MKIERLFIYCLLAGTSFLASCSNEEMTDNQVETLPEGMYPLTFTATQGEVVATPQTRVSEDEGGNSKWNGDEVIGVKIGENGTAGSYTLDSNGKPTTTNTPVYWQSTASQTVYGWYPNNTTDIPLEGQDDANKKFPYVLKGESSQQSYKNNVQLAFKNQLVKFRVELQGSVPNLSNANVFFYSYPTCGNECGAVTPKGNKEYLATRKVDGYYTAMLAPDANKTGEKFVKIEVNDWIYYYNPDITLTGGNVYTYTVNVNLPYTIKDGNDNPVSDFENIEQDITISGKYIPALTIKGTCAVTMDAAAIKTNDAPGISVDGKNVTLTLKVKGTGNSIDATNGAGISVSSGASVTIEGSTETASDSKLTVKANGTIGEGYGDGGSDAPGIGVVDDSTDKKITIKNITLDVTGGGASAAIGTGRIKYKGCKCDSITIKNSVIKATGPSGAAAIGTGRVFGGDKDTTHEIGTITIEDSTIKAELESYNNHYGACIGLGVRHALGTSKCGKIHITTDDNETTFMSNLHRDANNADNKGCDGYKIGYGDILYDPDDPNECIRFFSGVWINNTRKDTGNNAEKGYSGQ